MPFDSTRAKVVKDVAWMSALFSIYLF
jgi:hypothetical protein